MYVRNEVTDEHSSILFYYCTTYEVETSKHDTVQYHEPTPPRTVRLLLLQVHTVVLQTGTCTVCTYRGKTTTNKYVHDGRGDDNDTTKSTRREDGTVLHARNTTHDARSMVIQFEEEGLRLDLVYEGGRQVVCSDEAYHGLT